MVNVAAAELAPWTAPAPAELADWRTRIRDYYRTLPGMRSLSAAINAGQASLLPVVPGTARFSPGAIASQLLARLEEHTLAHAALYYATADMTSLALAAASTPPGEPVTVRRLPAPRGLMLFEQPIGGYTETVDTLVSGAGFTGGPGLAVTTPIVAVSWSEWSPHDLVIGGGPQPRWLFHTPAGLTPVPDGFDGIRLTFYAPAEDKFGHLPSGAVIATGPDHTPITAGDLRRFRDDHGGFTLPPLVWDNECLLRSGAGFNTPTPDTTDQWAQVVYTAWQLISQAGPGTPLTTTEDLPRTRAGRRRDQRNGITATGVRVVRVHSAHRPTPAAAGQDAANSTGRRAPDWTCRWPVRPYRRSTCLNPHGHADGDCRHEDRIVPAHIKGPPGKPLRITDTVNLWDTQPDP